MIDNDNDTGNKNRHEISHSKGSRAGCLFCISFFLGIPFFLFFSVLESPVSNAFANNLVQRVEIGSSPNPVGSGARALGMGGAFIGIADDATAASWNPAGLIQLELPEISMVGAHGRRRGKLSSASISHLESNSGIDKTDLNYLSLAYPFHGLGRNMIFSINYQHLYDFNKNMKLHYEEAHEEYDFHLDTAFVQSGALSTLSPAWAVQIHPSFALGLTLNFWKPGLSDNQWRSRYQFDQMFDRSSDQTFFSNSVKETYEFDGLNFHAGFLWNVNGMLSLGGVFKSPFRADIRHTYERYDLTEGTFSLQQERETLDMPMSYGIGMGLRMSDALSFGLDIYRTEWSDYLLNTAEGESITLITGKKEKESDIDATTQVRLGMEYLKILQKTIIPFRLGLFYDPAPAQGNPEDFFGFSAGSGFMYGRAVFDLAYQYRMGNDVTIINLPDFDLSQDIREHMVYFSMIIHL